jgi:Pseudouridine synthase
MKIKSGPRSKNSAAISTSCRPWFLQKNTAGALYKLAREGKVVEREPRLVHVYRYTIDRIASPEIDFSVLCSKGFYVRTYVHDIGEALVAARI